MSRYGTDIKKMLTNLKSESFKIGQYDNNIEIQRIISVKLFLSQKWRRKKKRRKTYVNLDFSLQLAYFIFSSAS
jgi:hypothetical protein